MIQVREEIEMMNGGHIGSSFAGGWKLEEFDYEVYRAAFAKRYVSMHVMC